MSVLDKSVLTLQQVMELELSIPNYQRPYKWTIKNVSQLIEDILENFEKTTDKSYRLGTVVFHQKSNDDNSKKHCIVDGQQRLVTLTLICYYLEKKPLEAKLSILDNEFNSLSKGNIQCNAIYIKNRIEAIAVDKSELLEYIYNQCEVVSITLDDISEAFQFFDSQNSRGKTLEAYDLLKAFHLREMMECSDAEKNQCVEIWEKAVKTGDGKNKGTDRYTSSLKTIFDRLYRIRCWANDKSIKKYGKREDVGFTLDDISVFKGVNLSKGSAYPFSRSMLRADMFFHKTSKKYERLSCDCFQTFPFQIDQILINGKRFFEYIAYYKSLHEQLLNKNELKESFEVIQNLDGAGNWHIRRLFECTMLHYYDKFNDERLNDVTRLAMQWSYLLRKESSIYISSVDKAALNKDGLFVFIKEALQPKSVLTCEVKLGERPPPPKEGKDKYQDLWDYIYGKQTQESTTK